MSVENEREWREAFAVAMASMSPTYKTLSRTDFCYWISKGRPSECMAWWRMLNKYAPEKN